MFTKMGYHNAGDQTPWTRDMGKITALRQTGAVDDAVTRELLARAEGDIPTVFDSWTMPFIAHESSTLKSNVLFVQLESDINSRAIKCLVSQGAGSRSSISEAINIIKNKDNSSRDQFKEFFGIDIFQRATRIRSANMVRLNVSQYVFGSSAEQIRHGIRSAQLQLMTAIRKKFTPPYSES